MSSTASPQTQNPPRKRSSLVLNVVALASVGLLIAAYAGWQAYNRPVDPFLRLQQQIDDMNPAEREEARVLCAKFADQMYATADFKVDPNRCALVTEDGMRRLYGEATDPAKKRRIYWVIMRRASDEAEWEMAACGIEH